MKRIVLATIFALYGVALLAQAKPLPGFVTDSLSRYIVRGMADWNIPGLSVAIVKDGQVVFMQGFGVTKVNGRQAVDANTLFMIGSNTKAFTATTLALLQEAGAVNLNDKVQRWMPEFRLKDPLASREVTITDLLSHRIGFETFQGDFTYWTSTLTRGEVIKKMGLIDPVYGFRAKWGYCNAAFVTAGELIPRIISKSWEDAVRDSILIPLKMGSTLMLPTAMKSIANAASAHTLVEGELVEIPIPNISNIAPAGSMCSNATDMAKWLLAQLGNGMVDGRQVLSAKAVKAIRKPNSIIALDPRDKKSTHFYLYGMGLMITDRDGKVVYSHTGGVDGFLSSVMFVPEEKLGIVVLTNTDQNNFYMDLTNEILDSFLNLPYTGYSYTSLKGFKEEKVASDARIDSLRRIVSQHIKPSIPLAGFTGRYTSTVYGGIDIRQEGGLLNIYFSNHPGLIGRLAHLKGDTFLCTYSNPTMGIVELPFKLVNGKVTGLTLRVNSFVEATPYEFSREG